MGVLEQEEPEEEKEHGQDQEPPLNKDVQVASSSNNNRKKSKKNRIKKEAIVMQNNSIEAMLDRPSNDKKKQTKQSKSNPLTCSTCLIQFESRTQLFKHLNESGHAKAI